MKSFKSTESCSLHWKERLSLDGVASLPQPFFDLPFEECFDSDNLHSLQHDFISHKLHRSFSINLRNRLYINPKNLISGSDYSFMEIINPHLLPSNHNLSVNIDDVLFFLNSIGISDTPSYISFYVYKGIDLPRRLHHDTSYNSFKIFVAVTDIDDIDQGPYVYVKKSHIQKRYFLSDIISRFNILKTGGDAYDAAWIEWDNMFYGYIPRSHCFISNQRGIHGDLPAHASKKKIVLAICFNERGLSGFG